MVPGPAASASPEIVLEMHILRSQCQGGTEMVYIPSREQTMHSPTPTPHLVTGWGLEISPGGNIYIMEIGKHYKSVLIFLSENGFQLITRPHLDLLNQQL